MDDNKVSELLETVGSEITKPERENLHTKLMEYINWLLVNDFNKLIYILYRIDVDEKKLKNILAENKGTDSASIIADLMIQRQLQKAIQKKMARGQDDIPEHEKW